MPAWCALIQHRNTRCQFTEQHIARQDEVLAQWVTEFDRQYAEIPVTYLQEIGWNSKVEILSADLVRESKTHKCLAGKGIIDTTTALFSAAIKQSASVRLSGEDPFADDRLFSYYGCVDNGVQVAGTKNQFYFLESVFTVKWLGAEHQWKSSEYQFQEKGTVSQEISELLRCLFLAKRTFPAIHTCEAGNRWPGTDDKTIQGYLTPEEVNRLSEILPGISSLKAARDDELFPLFSNRVQRAASQRFGLVTLFAGLFGDWC
jgi:hypothetical protein